MSISRRINFEVNYLFIDGGCLRSTLNDYSKRFFNEEPIEFDYQKLAQEFDKVFYYDSLLPKNSNEKEEEYEERVQKQIDFFTHLSLLNGYHVYEGTTRKRRRGIEQKKVDIMIAVHMLNHSFRKNMTKATLLTADLDFKPLIDALVDSGMYISLWYPINKTNQELIQSADSSRKLDINSIYQYSTINFQHSHLIPSFKNKIGMDVKNVKEIEDVHNQFGIKGKLYKGNDRNIFYLVFPKNYNTKVYAHLEFHDPEILKEYFNEFSLK